MSIQKMIKKLFYCFFERKYSVRYFWEIRKKAMEGGFIAKRKYRRLQVKNGAYIPLSVQFSGDAVLPHGISGIFISAGAKIGKDCIIFQQVTIGSNTLPGGKSTGSPVLGDNVFVGAGAKIIGNVKIGNHARIGANCIVTKDVPDNCTVVMEQPRMIMHENVLNNEYVPYDKYSADDAVIVD